MYLYEGMVSGKQTAPAIDVLRIRMFSEDPSSLRGFLAKYAFQLCLLELCSKNKRKSQPECHLWFQSGMQK